MIYILKFIICFLLAVDCIGSYRMLQDKWTALEEVFIWLFIAAKITAIGWILSL